MCSSVLLDFQLVAHIGILHHALGHIKGDYVLTLTGNHTQILGLAHPVIHLHVKAFNLSINRGGDGAVLHLPFISQFSGLILELRGFHRVDILLVFLLGQIAAAVKNLHSSQVALGL